MRRFWRAVTLSRGGGGWQVALDGRGMLTQGCRLPQTVPNRALGELLAAEWESQGEEVDPASFPARDLADFAIDEIAFDQNAAIARLLPYADTDTLCYRAHPDEPLHDHQRREWDPLIERLADRVGARLKPVSGIVHRPQDGAALARLRKLLETYDPFTLAAMETMASLSASLTVPLLFIEDAGDPGTLWDAAELEQRWQRERWGEDEEAAANAARRREAFFHAAAFAAAARTRDAAA
jgi:chaperone required for assembly of F1-ATPase